MKLLQHDRPGKMSHDRLLVDPIPQNYDTARTISSLRLGFRVGRRRRGTAVARGGRGLLYSTAHCATLPGFEQVTYAGHLVFGLNPRGPYKRSPQSPLVSAVRIALLEKSDAPSPSDPPITIRSILPSPSRAPGGRSNIMPPSSESINPSIRVSSGGGYRSSSAAPPPPGTLRSTRSPAISSSASGGPSPPAASPSPASGSL
ncbi:hypothetical protein BHM03_00029594 [Ensete ventricosum]|uniref:Uncharacterized protein n=1 Tax=Ensete ventricosum TaxID=4639 RepID=A0A427AZA4_ENSVE|nr:hypothetical protein B296_00020579 [Ensete ventricosum]RZR99954.1 hypothetical protein BHM03_00029594 [Ensete ventricosum]